MDKLIEYIAAHVQRGACECGRCADAEWTQQKARDAMVLGDIQSLRVDHGPHQVKPLLRVTGWDDRTIVVNTALPQRGHTADLVFFKMRATNSPGGTELLHLLDDAGGHFLVDGAEHSYIEVGGFMGDQGLGLMLMGLGHLLGIWTLITPRDLFGEAARNSAMNLAGAGFVAIRRDL